MLLYIPCEMNSVRSRERHSWNDLVAMGRWTETCASVYLLTACMWRCVWRSCADSTASLLTSLRLCSVLLSSSRLFVGHSKDGAKIAASSLSHFYFLSCDCWMCSALVSAYFPRLLCASSSRSSLQPPCVFSQHHPLWSCLIPAFILHHASPTQV